MQKIILLMVTLFVVSGCNSVYIRPGAHMDSNAKVYASRGGYSMARNIKQEFERRGYDVNVGKLSKDTKGSGDAAGINLENFHLSSDVAYVVKVEEREDRIRPFWCVLNGFWWWDFNVSVAEQKTGHELMTWRGRGCANSSMRKLSRILDCMENNDETGNFEFNNRHNSRM